MLANSYLVYALHKLKKLSLVSYTFVLYLSISDIFMGFLGIVRNSFTSADVRIIDSKHPLYEFFQWIIAFQNFFINFSLACILIIAVDRFIHMRYMTRYNNIMNKRRGVIIIVINVIFTTHTVTVTKLLPVYELDNLWRHVTAYRTYRVILSFIYIGLIVSIFFIYLWAYRSIKKRVESLVSFKPANTAAAGLRASKIEESGTRTRNRRRSPDQEFAKGMMYITLSLLLCVVPNLSCTVFIRILKMNGDRETFERVKQHVVHLQRWSYLALLLNPTLNAIILIICSGELRAYTKQFFGCFGRHVRPDLQDKKNSSQSATEL